MKAQESSHFHCFVQLICTSLFISYGLLSFPTTCIKRFPLFYFLIKNRVEKKIIVIQSQDTEKSICDGKETNTCKCFLESQQLFVGLFRLVPMAFLGFILRRKGHHHIFLLSIINPPYSAGPNTRRSPWQTFPSCHGPSRTLSSTCEHKHCPARKGKRDSQVGLCRSSHCHG